jgi:hypothetical protein
VYLFNLIVCIQGRVSLEWGMNRKDSKCVKGERRRDNERKRARGV